MAISSDHSTPATSCVAMHKLRTRLVAASWTVPKDSDATTYSSSGAQCTSGASGAGGFGNDRAWFVVQSPGGQQWCIQVVSAASATYRVKVSPSAGFVTSPGATVTPSASDELVIHGAGTDASPTGATLFGTDGTYRLEVETDSSLNGWTLQTFTTGASGGTRTLMKHDALAAGSYPSGDTQPVVYRCAYHASNTLTDYSSVTYLGQFSAASYTASSGVPVKRCQHGTGSAAWRPVGVLTYWCVSVGAVPSMELGTEAYGGGESPLPVIYARRGGTQGGVIGTSTQSYVGTASTSRISGDVLQVGAAYYQRGDQEWFPWDATTVVQ